MDKIKICAWCGIVMAILVPLSIFLFYMFIPFILLFIAFNLGFYFVGKKYGSKPLKMIPIIFLAISILTVIVTFFWFGAVASSHGSLFGFPNFGLIVVMLGIMGILLMIYSVYNLLMSIFIMRIKSIKIARAAGIVGIISSCLIFIIIPYVALTFFSRSTPLLYFLGIMSSINSIIFLADFIIKIMFMFQAAKGKAAVSSRR